MTLRTGLAIGAAVLAMAAAALAVVRAEGAAPAVAAPERVWVGVAGSGVELAVSDEGSGVRSVRATLHHARGEAAVAEREFDGNLLFGGRRSADPVTFLARVDPELLELRDGEAFLEIEVRDWSWRGAFGGNATRVEIPVTIDLEPPRIRVESGLTYVRRGGSALVVYTLSEDTLHDGVIVDEAFYPGFPLATDGAPPSAGAGSETNAGRSRRRGALFAVPTDAPGEPRLRVVAADFARNESTASWPARVRARSLPEASVTLTPRFLDGKVRELAMSAGIDSPDGVAAFRKVNSELRRSSETRIRAALPEVPGARQWTGAFQQLRNSQVTSRFAERRTYFANGQRVSQATHFGFDLASTAGAPITAANHGSVILAEEVGIYGSCVMIDHGMGLTSLYAHLSRIDVAPGDWVEKGTPLGLSGATGLAGGDHLHYSMLVGDTYVDPLEWWDSKWVRESIEARLAPRRP